MTAAGVISGYKDGTFGPGDDPHPGAGDQGPRAVAGRGAGQARRPRPSPISTTSTATTWRPPRAKGWITGFPDGRFRPYYTLSRQQMAIIMVRAMGWDAEAKKLAPSQIARDSRGLLRRRGHRHRRSALCGSGRTAGSLRRDQRPLQAQGRHHPGPVRSGGVQGRTQHAGRHPAGALRGRLSRQDPRGHRPLPGSRQGHGRHLRGRHAHRRLPGGRHRRHALPGRAISLEVKSVGARQYAYDPRTVRVTLDLARYRDLPGDVSRPFGGQGLPPRRGCLPAHGRSRRRRAAADLRRPRARRRSPPAPSGVSGTHEKDFNLAIALLAGGRPAQVPVSG